MPTNDPRPVLILAGRPPIVAEQCLIECNDRKALCLADVKARYKDCEESAGFIYQLTFGGSLLIVLLVGLTIGAVKSSWITSSISRNGSPAPLLATSFLGFLATLAICGVVARDQYRLALSECRQAKTKDLLHCADRYDACIKRCERRYSIKAASSTNPS
jgi:hypothetical protein